MPWRAAVDRAYRRQRREPSPRPDESGRRHEGHVEPLHAATADVNYTTDTITLPYTLGVSNDDAVIYSAGGGTPIGGLVDGGEYYAIANVRELDKLRLSTKRCGAVTHSATRTAGTSVR